MWEAHVRGPSERPCERPHNRPCERPKWEAQVRGQSERPCERSNWEAKVGGHGRPKWEAAGGQSGRPQEAKVGGQWEAMWGRKWEAVGGCAPLIGSDRSHDKLWEAEPMGGHVRQCEAEFGRPWEAVGGCAPLIGCEICLSQSEEHGLPRPPTASQIRPPKHIKWPISLTFDSNSTSDWKSDVLKTMVLRCGSRICVRGQATFCRHHVAESRRQQKFGPQNWRSDDPGPP